MAEWLRRVVSLPSEKVPAPPSPNCTLLSGSRWPFCQNAPTWRTRSSTAHPRSLCIKTRYVRVCNRLNLSQLRNATAFQAGGNDVIHPELNGINDKQSRTLARIHRPACYRQICNTLRRNAANPGCFQAQMTLIIALEGQAYVAESPPPHNSTTPD